MLSFVKTRGINGTAGEDVTAYFRMFFTPCNMSRWNIAIGLPMHFLISLRASYSRIDSYQSTKHIEGLEKPGTCPVETEDIIRVCVADCTADRDCSGRSKCCWNGCVHRCAKPQASENAPNYLNLPLISDDD